MSKPGFVHETPTATVRVHWGRYIRDGKVTQEGMPVITEAMVQFGSGILKENPNYFNNRENRK